MTTYEKEFEEFVSNYQNELGKTFTYQEKMQLIETFFTGYELGVKRCKRMICGNETSEENVTNVSQSVLKHSKKLWTFKNIFAKMF